AAGHSLGEYTALTAAGALAFADALPLVHFRAQAMQEAVPQGQGAMAAVLNLDDEHVVAACAEVEAMRGGVVQAVNFNAPGQVVESGATHIVECGPGRVLAGMTKRIAPQVQSLALNDRAALEAALRAVKGA